MKSKEYEFWGLILVLLSSFVQFFVLNESQDLTDSAVTYKLEKKLDDIFRASRSNFQALHPDEPQTLVWVNPDVFDEYEYAQDNNRLEHTKAQTDWLGKVVGVLFLIGSGLIIWAKRLELVAEKQRLSQLRL
ncbi:hypothetical protein [Vibrio rotiferianus]|uniref:hypothetical protein n=1 Tax=Vibrio rotiferianus TaxID=190895 RepID=UPI002895B5AB|nr:hypothetical protein THOE12_190005 [Vibrio rotiferianus]